MGEYAVKDRWWVVMALACALLLSMAPLAQAEPAAQEAEGSAIWPVYLIRPAAPNAMIVVDPGVGAEASAATAGAEEEQRDALEAELAALVADGLAGGYGYDERQAVFRAGLSEAGVAALRASMLVAEVEAEPTEAGKEPGAALLPADLAPVTSVIFAQVNSPLVWGNTNIGGLDVQLTLETADGTVIGVPSGSCGVLPNCVYVNPDPLYFETTFVDPIDRTKYVPMRPGDYVHVITSGDNPGTPAYPDPSEDKRVQIVSLSACGLPEADRVEGTTVPNADVIVTLTSPTASLYLATSYLTPGSNMTYAEVKSDASGRFTAATFRTTADATYKVKDIVQGNKGFARVRLLGSSGQPTGDEVWTLWGQNVYVLQNSPVVHGYAFRLPAAPSGVLTAYKATRPTPGLTAELKAPGGAIKATASAGSSTTQPYTVSFDPATIMAGDSVRVAIDYDGNIAFDQTVAVLPVTAAANLSINQVTGTGPANTGMVIGAGNVQGYVTESSRYDAWEARVTASATGAYASGPVTCGTSDVVQLQPGSFGYVGYEAPCGNFVYTAYAAPIAAAMSGFNYVDGWMATGLEQPTVAVSAAGGAVKQAAQPATKRLFWLLYDKLYVNTYYNAATSVYIDPGDTVTVASGGRVHTIPVDDLEARLYAEQDIVAGKAPANTVLRVIPEQDRAAWKQIQASAGGTYAAANPYLTAAQRPAR